jgi:glycosyltransferase involved in cell wall biosynthesis
MPQPKRQTSLRILIVTPSLGLGGAERQAIRLANEFHASGYSVHIFAISRSTFEFANSLKAGIEVTFGCSFLHFGFLNASASFGRLRAFIRKADPDVVISLLVVTSCLLRFAIWGRLRSRVKFIVGIQNNLVAQFRSARVSGWFWSWLFRFALRDADSVVALSHGAAAATTRLYPFVRQKITVSHNAGFDSTVQESNVTVADRCRGSLVACGRLHIQKDYEFMLRAFAEIKKQCPYAKLTILGTGILESDLRELVVSLGIADSVYLRGFCKDPLAEMRRHQILLLTSRWEGFANVIVEASSVGTPVIAVDCPYGPAEIIESYKNGILIPIGQAGAFADAVRGLVEDKALWERLSSAAIYRASEFSPQRSALGYIRCFMNTGASV